MTEWVLETTALALSIFVTVSFLWLGLTVLLNGDLRPRPADASRWQACKPWHWGVRPSRSVRGFNARAYGRTSAATSRVSSANLRRQSAAECPGCGARWRVCPQAP
jgi:hypothetical protein